MTDASMPHDEPPPGYHQLLEMPPTGQAWWVVHARPRCEKKVADLALQKGASVFLPLQRKVHFYGRRRRVFWNPLFSGYVFLTWPLSNLAWLRQNQHVANVLEVPGQARLVDQLNAVRLAITACDDLEVIPRVEVGQKVRIQGGPMKGVQGIITRIKGQDRVILNVDMIGTAVALEVESLFLSKEG